MKSQLVAIVSDIHFDLHDVPTWHAFRKWHKDVKPDKTVFLGDFIDLGMMSRYSQGKDDPLFAIPQIKAFIKEIKRELTDSHFPAPSYNLPKYVTLESL